MGAAVVGTGANAEIQQQQFNSLIKFWLSLQTIRYQMVKKEHLSENSDSSKSLGTHLMWQQTDYFECLCPRSLQLLLHLSGKNSIVGNKHFKVFG